MKKYLILSLFASVTISYASAQAPDKTDSIKAGWGTVDYAVPESPAFKILGTSPSNIMRPSATRDIAVSIGNYFVNNGATIPQNMAVEISPTIFSPHLNLKKFRDNSFWYTSALSIGTKVNADKSYAIGIGFKVKLLDKQDLRKDDGFLDTCTIYDHVLTDVYTDAIETVTQMYMASDPKKQTHLVWHETIVTAYKNADEKNTYYELIKSQIVSEMTKLYTTHGPDFGPKKVTEYRDARKKALWNQPVWDLGVATLFNSKDSLLANIKAASKVGLWSTYGLPIFGTKGQILFGVNGQLRDTLTSKLKIKTLNLGSRAYYGSNDTKGFVEVNVMMQSYQQATYKASIGLEQAFLNGMWIDFNLGFAKQGDGKAIFAPGFNLLFGNGEKKIPGS